MQPNKRTVHEFIFRTDGYFQIPDFQRPYSWGNYQTDTFLSDLEKTAKNQNTHYFGTIVLIKENDHTVIIDGQQRLTTSLLLINAAYHVLKKTPEKSFNYDADRIKDQYLVNTYNSNAQNREKITLRTVTTDNRVLEKLFCGEELDSNEKANKLFKAYTKFKAFFESLDCVDHYLEALKKFEIVEITLDSSDDNPQLVFENINSTGEPLSAGDKIRNWALMLNNERARQTVYNDYWKKIENKLTRVENGKQVDYISDFFRTYLMCKNNAFISDADTYPLFKNLLSEKIRDDDIESLKAFYDDVMQYLSPYLTIKFMDKNLEFKVFDDQVFSLKFLQTETINSFVINLFVDFVDGKLTQEEVANSLSLVESFLVRRIICGFKTEAYNKIFPELYKSMRTSQEKNLKKTFDDCLSARMMEARGRTSFFPTDADIDNSVSLLNFSSNNSNQKQFVLAKICDQSKESMVLRSIAEKQIKLTIEHIMPQSLRHPKWKVELGSHWENVHNKWLHTLANLTLTAYNSKYSDRPFSEKKTMQDGFSQSPLLLNQYIAKFEQWNEDSLEKRAKWLSDQIVNIWKYPKSSLSLSDEIEEDDNSYSPYEWEAKARRKPATVTINNEFTEVNSWIELYVAVMRFIQENFSEEFNQLIDDSHLFGVSARPLITRNKSIPNIAKELSHGVFFESNLSAQAIMKNVVRICEHVGYDEANCPVSFTLQ